MTRGQKISEGLTAEFKPCRIDFEESGIIQYLFEDTAYFARPVEGMPPHTVDWLIAGDDGRLVGMQFWPGAHQ